MRLAALLLAPLLAGQDPVPPGPAVKLPAEVKAQPGRLVKLAAATEGKAVRWLVTSEDADLVPFPDGKTAIFCASRPGRYAVYAWTAAGDIPSEAARCVVVVGDPVPPVPPPGPPVPPPPTDPLRVKVKAAFDADPSPAKKGAAKDLALLYRRGADLAVLKSNGEYVVLTPAELIRRIKEAGGNLTGDVLRGVREIVADELGQILTTDAPLTEGQRLAAASLFARLAAILDSF